MTMRDDAVANAKVSQAMPRKIRERPALQISKKDGQEDDRPVDDDAKLLTTHPDAPAGGLRGQWGWVKGGDGCPNR